MIELDIERTIGLELERIAMHIGDLSNMCIGLAYQLGAAVFGALRTPTINYSQLWCGNRFGKGLIRVGGTHYPLERNSRTRFSNSSKILKAGSRRWRQNYLLYPAR